MNIEAVNVVYSFAAKLWRIELSLKDGSYWPLQFTKTRHEAITRAERFASVCGLPMTVWGQAWVVV